EEMLANWGMKPALVESGPAALAALEAGREADQPFALVLLDAMMPEMDGFALAEAILRTEGPGEGETGRRGEPTSGLAPSPRRLVSPSPPRPVPPSPVLMMLSSAGQAGDAARCRELGVASYLTKPIRQSQL